MSEGATDYEIDALHKAWKAIVGTTWQRIADGTMIQIDPMDRAIRQGDLEQSIRCYQAFKRLKEEPLVSEDLQKKIVWYPEKEREALLQRLFDHRKALIKFFTDRITIPSEILDQEIKKLAKK